MQATRRAAMACIVTVLVHMYSGMPAFLFTCISASTRSNRSAISPPAVAMPHAEPLAARAEALARLFGMLTDYTSSIYLKYSWEHDTALLAQGDDHGTVSMALRRRL
jgi:hypothetical protein